MKRGPSNRHKVRGYRRRLRALDRFADAHAGLDLDALRLRHYDYVKLWLDPWSRLAKRNPPMGYRRPALRAFFRIAEAWDRQLRTLGEPYYLAVWLHDPRFHATQVVAGLRERIGWYETVFPERAAAPPPFDRYGVGADARTACRWAGWVDVDPVYEPGDEAVRWVRRGGVWEARWPSPA